MTRRLRVLVLTPFYLPGFAGGGPIRTLAAMVASHHERHDFAVLTSVYDWGADEPLSVPTDRWTAVGGARVRYLGRQGAVRSGLEVLRLVRRSRPDVLYLNGLFPPVWSLAPAVLARLGLAHGPRLLVAPRGELGAGALAIKADKKRIFLRTARLTGLYQGATWHASTPGEAAEIVAAFPGARVLVRENETELPTHATHPDAAGEATPLVGETGVDSRRADAPRGRTPVRLLYVSRLSEKKGLHVLLQALALVVPPVVLDIAGGGDPTYEARCRGLVAALPDRHQVRWLGSLPPHALSQLYATHDALALPTAHENFGHVVPEALARGCPVLLPDTTPWSAALTSGGGRLVPSREPDDWAAAVTSMATTTAEDRLLARHGAARAYDAWAAARPTHSVFDLLDAP